MAVRWGIGSEDVRGAPGVAVKMRRLDVHLEPSPQQRVLIAPGYLSMLKSLLRGLECEIEVAADGSAVLDLVRLRAPDLLLLGTDVPGINGFDLCAAVKATPSVPWLPVIIVAARTRIDDHQRSLDAGADDVLTKPISHVELRARVRSLLRLKSMHDSLDDTDRVIFSLAAAVEAKDNYTEAHTERVALTSRALGESLDLDGPDLDALYSGGKIHDLGKLAVPDQVLLKPGPLTEAELVLIRAHPVTGEDIIRPLRSATALRAIVRHHHERYDGGGYPDGLAGQAIPLLARIVAICDSYDAMTSDRPYRAGRTQAEALAALKAGAGTQWDPELVRIFTGRVVALHDRLRPTP